MKMQRLMKKMRRATALILAGLMIAMTVDISGLKVRAEEKQNNDTVIAASDSEKLDVSKMNIAHGAFRYGQGHATTHMPTKRCEVLPTTPPTPTTTGKAAFTTICSMLTPRAYSKSRVTMAPQLALPKCCCRAVPTH